MLHLRGTFKLALTKLRIRKLRLILTVGITSLLFSVLFFAAPIAKGTFDSIERFGQQGLGKRYVTQATLPAQGAAINNETIINRALDIYADQLSQKKAAAKKLGIAFDATSELSPVTETDTPTGKVHNLNVQHPAAKAAIKEYLAQHPLLGAAELRKAAATYHPISFYESKQLQNGYTGGQLQVLKNGQENFVGGQTNEQDPLDTFTFSWASTDRALIQPFVLPGKDLDIAADGSIPLVIPLSAAESLLKVDPLPNNAAPEATIKHMQEVRSKAADLSFEVCYRNQLSTDLIASVLNTQKEIERNKKNADYQKPALIYGLPSTTCGSPEIIRDTRSADQKATDAKQAQLDAMFGPAGPVQQKLRFVVAGVSPDKKGGSASNVNQIIGSVVNSSLGYGWYMPSSAEKQSPLLAQLFTEDAYYLGLGRNYYAEFASADNARIFVNEKGCSVDSAMRSEGDNCAKTGKLFTLTAFGSNTVGLESLKQQFNSIFTIALLAIAAIASLVMGNTLGRMIADSRRETAVFRAIGAKRSDIAGIYLTYVTLLSAMIAVVSVVVGTSLAYIANAVLSPLATSQAIAIYSVQDTTMVFDLFNVNWQSLILIMILILAVGYIAAAQPLLRNVKRNPIQDMREDT